jgi:UDP-N-acetylglucosamine 3-dehydrogenase
MRAAVIGVGAIGRNHARLYNEIEGVELVAVADSDAAAAARVGGQLHTRHYGDYRAMLEQEQLEAVSVAVPTMLHHQVALDCLAARLNVLVEKPIAATVAEGEAMIAAANKAGVKFTVGHIERFNPAIIELKRRLDAGEIGRVFQVHARRLGPFPARIRDVGVVIDLAIHDVDIMRYLIGSEVQRVYAETAQNLNTAHEDLLSGLLRFEGGTIGVLDINWLTPTKVRELMVTGEKGMFLASYLTQDLYYYENDYINAEWDTISNITGVSEGKMVRLRIDRKEPLRVELESFIRCIATDTAPVVSGADGLRALEVVQKIVEAGEQHRAIDLQP